MIAKLRETILKPDTMFKKPLIVGGLGLTLGVSLWQTLVPSLSDVLGLATWGAIALGAGAWWLNKRNVQPLDVGPAFPEVVNRETVNAAIADAGAAIDQFAAAVTDTATRPTQYEEAIAHLRQKQRRLSTAVDRTQLNGVVIGAKGVGKTALVAQLASQSWASDPYSMIFLDTTAILMAPANGVLQASTVDVDSVVATLRHADVVLFATEGDVTASEFSVVQALLAENHEVVLVFNKQDQYLPTERLDILNRIRERLVAHLDADKIVSTSAVTTKLKVRQHQADGAVTERMDERPPNVDSLAQQVQTVLTQNPERLVWNSTLRQVHQLKQDVQQQWHRLRREQALPVIEKYQWVAAAAAFANPLPSFDLVATGAINAQLVADLGEVYEQPFSLDQATVTTRNLGELMVKLGLVELTTQAIAPLLKTHVLTFAAGGAVQGLSAAYLTHVAGLSLIQYFEERSVLAAKDAEAEWNLERLGQIVSDVFHSYQRGSFLQSLVDNGIKRFAARVGEQPMAAKVATPSMVEG